MSFPIGVGGEMLKTHVTHSRRHVLEMRLFHMIVQGRLVVIQLLTFGAFEGELGLGGNFLHMRVHVLLLLLQLMEHRVAERTFEDGLVSDDGASVIGDAMRVKACHGFERHRAGLALVVGLAVRRDDVRPDQIHLRVHDGLAAFRALISRTSTVVETHELQVSVESGFLVEQRAAFGTNERTRFRVDSFMRRQSARGRSVEEAVALIGFIDILLPFPEMHLQGGDGLSADRTLGAFQKTAFW